MRAIRLRRVLGIKLMTAAVSQIHDVADSHKHHDRRPRETCRAASSEYAAPHARPRCCALSARHERSGLSASARRRDA
jgi:hypothetical protein